MKKSLFTGLCASLLLLFPSCNQQVEANNEVVEKDGVKREDIRAYIQAMEDTLAMAYNNKDAALFEKFYAPGAVTYGEGREQLFGKKNMVNHFKENVVNDTTSTATFSYQTIDVFAGDNYAVETGRWEEINEDGTEVDHGFYMVLFEKQDGRYVSIRDIWNSSTKD